MRFWTTANLKTFCALRPPFCAHRHRGTKLVLWCRLEYTQAPKNAFCALRRGARGRPEIDLQKTHMWAQCLLRPISDGSNGGLCEPHMWAQCLLLPIPDGRNRGLCEPRMWAQCLLLPIQDGRNRGLCEPHMWAQCLLLRIHDGRNRGLCEPHMWAQRLLLSISDGPRRKPRALARGRMRPSAHFRWAKTRALGSRMQRGVRFCPFKMGQRQGLAALAWGWARATTRAPTPASTSTPSLGGTRNGPKVE